MKSVEVTGKTVDEAITSALLQLGASSDQVDIEILEEGNHGLLGFLKKSVKIRATLKEGEEQVVETDESKLADMRAAAEEKAAQTASEVSVPSEQPQAAVQETGAVGKPVQAPEAPKKVAEAVTVTGETVIIDDSIEQRLHKANEERARSGKAQNPSSYEKKRTPAPEPEEPQTETEEPKVYTIPEDAEAVKKTVIDFLTEVLQAMGIQTTISAEFSEDAILEVDIQGEGMGVIIGKRGATLDSLQYLTTLVVNKGREDHVRIKLDTEGYRARRQETLEKLAINLARKAKRTGRSVTLEPMNPYERRIIHSILQSDRGVETHSEGEEPYRHVVITPRKRH